MLKKHQPYSRLILMFLLVCSSIQSYAQINVYPSQTANSLAEKLAGQGVTILNTTLNCPAVANGFFNITNSNLGLDSGIVLTTGRAATQGVQYGVNGLSTYLASNDNVASGDAQLDVLAGLTTYDACALAFDVVPYGDTIKFDYVFSSEEYMNAVCGTFNDAFAFFISGSGIVGTENMALIPGTLIPVTINSVNNGIPGASGNIRNCNNMGPGSPFTTYYIDNTTGQTLTHKGFTTVMQAIHAVTPCDTYHLKIAIADAGDPLYDSGVFLKAGSLQTSSYSIAAVAPAIADAAYCIKGCLPGKFIIKTTQQSNLPQTLKIVTGGNAISGIDYQPIADTITIPAFATQTELLVTGLPTPLNGNKILTLYILAPFTCSGNNAIIDSASMIIYDTLHITLSVTDTAICAATNVQLMVSGCNLLSYSWLPTYSLSNALIYNPIAFPSVNTVYTVTASVPGTLCVAQTAEVNFTIKLSPVIIPNPNTNICYHHNLQLFANTTYSNEYYSYLWQAPNGVTTTCNSLILNNIDATIAGIYSLTVTIDTNSCTATSVTDIGVYIPDTPIVTSPTIFCIGDTVSYTNIIGYNLHWYNTQEDTETIAQPVINTNTVANYQYYISQNLNRCESPRIPYEIEIKKCCDGILFIPTAFTPNGDGRNDKFVIHEDYGYYIKNLVIFNRWGQLVYKGKEGIWDGKYEGQTCEMGTYYYDISFGCIKGGFIEKRGDVTLVR